MSEITPASSEILRNQQSAFLLQQLASAPEGRLSQSDANSAIPVQFKKELQLTAKSANDLRREMVSSGWLSEEKNGRNVTYSVTAEGRRQLQDLERYLPLLPAKGIVNPPSNDQSRIARDVFVLDVLFRAADHTISRAALDASFGGRPKLKGTELAIKHPDVVAFRDQHCLGLSPATTRAVLSELALRGDISVHRTKDSESYALTGAGMELLARLRSESPILPPTGKPAPAPNESIRRGREAFLLLKLLEAPDYTASAIDAQSISYPKPLKLNHATAWQVRSELAREGKITIQWDGKSGRYSLTPAGKRYLAALPFDALGEVKIHGATLTALLAVARERVNPAATEVPPPSERRMPDARPTVEQLEAAVMDIFHDLLRERYTVIGMVPIHEVRREVTARFGSHAASHAVLDDLILGLRRAKKVRLISISDRSRASPEQLQQSIVSVGETFFYLEKAHDHVPSG